jgi:hypothetical protein
MYSLHQTILPTARTPFKLRQAALERNRSHHRSCSAGGSMDHRAGWPLHHALNTSPDDCRATMITARRRVASTPQVHLNHQLRTILQVRLQSGATLESRPYFKLAKRSSGLARMHSSASCSRKIPKKNVTSEIQRIPSSLGMAWKVHSCSHDTHLLAQLSSGHLTSTLRMTSCCHFCAP